MGTCPFGCLQFFHANKFLSLSLWGGSPRLPTHFCIILTCENVSGVTIIFSSVLLLVLCYLDGTQVPLTERVGMAGLPHPSWIRH